MVLQLSGYPVIENLRNYPAETVGELRTLLGAGAEAYVHPGRKNFYDLKQGPRCFFIHVAPNGKVLLLASWLKGGPASMPPPTEGAPA